MVNEPAIGDIVFNAHEDNVDEKVKVNVKVKVGKEELEPIQEITEYPANISNNISFISIWFIVWLVGMILCISFFVISYLHCLFKFKTSLPVQNDFVDQWLETHKLRRPISIRQSDRISSPLTYGVFHPVILMPKNTEWENMNQLQYIFLHEYIHICHYDIVIKFIFTLALCIHWFNPFVWVMYVLFNRDIELACDESVVHRFGEASKSIYAGMLVNMEVKKSGLMPFSNNFSKNAIEERIRAIMKIKKISIFTILISVLLITFVTTVFVTSAANKNEHSENSVEKEKNIPGTDFSEEEYEKLLALQFDGYEDMSISEYQNKVWELTDTKDYRDLLNRLSEDSMLYEMRDIDETASFLYNILEPLTAEKWQERDFSGYTTTDSSATSDSAVFEFVFILNIQNPYKLTVGEYNNTRLGIKSELVNILHDKSQDDLQSEEIMNELLSLEIDDIIEKWSSDKLEVYIDYSFMPMMDYSEEIQSSMQEELDKELTIYTPFGLTYEYDSSIGEYRMYYEGKEVRGLFDEVKGIWISMHQGIGLGIYDDNAIELYAVYEEGKLVGLRKATAEEQAELSSQRRQTTSEGKRIGELLYSEEEIREYPNGTKEDYDSLLELKTPDYQNLTVADFNMNLLEWANEDHERMEGINIDIGQNDFKVSLTDEELSFLKLTVFLSGMENGKYVQSSYTGRPEEDVIYSQYLLQKISDVKNGRSAWCDLYYQFSYHITDKKTLTIGERDRIIGGMIYDIEDFWNETDIEDMLKMSKNDVVEKLCEIAEKYSDSNITITVRNNHISFEKMDEREIEVATYDN
ncbi:MAG: M56 family metallopeptidase [Lachnospiraceae bacterium]|nr:M56 family metallopeptidase [Lachnospiraceae bacterium]